MEHQDLPARVVIDKSSSPELRIERDKCLTFLKKNIDASIKQARYIYRRDKKLSARFMIHPSKRIPV